MNIDSRDDLLITRGILLVGPTIPVVLVARAIIEGGAEVLGVGMALAAFLTLAAAGVSVLAWPKQGEL